MEDRLVIRDFVSDGPVLLDGAWGTQLQAKGLTAGEIPDHWNLSHPNRVEQVARAYVEAGSRVILTNTFRSNGVTLGVSPNDPLVEDLNRAGVEISKRAAGNSSKVFASIGPSGKLLVMGEIGKDELADAFRAQAAVMASAGADAIVVETMSDLEEAKLAALAAQSTGLPVVSCMVFDSGKNRDRTMMGVTPEQAAEELTRQGVDAVGANCGDGIDRYVPVCQRLRSSSHLPIWIKANAGVPELVGSQPVYRTSPADFASQIPSLITAGASFIGGCCGTGPEFIRAARDLLYK